ncbi:MAG TPA: GNAT family N-acetyltransferase [Gemmatimonadaceae bacterium]|nr:GNAT family N-acetyltransferase [Gemmatimonadaceae bacterium]
MIVVQTQRLMLRHATADDAAFVLRLLNEPSFLRFIGDRGVRTLDDARGYITERFIGSYERHDFGMWVVERRDAPGPIGISGLVKRDTLPEPDIGFAFLPEHWARGYALESALAVRDFAFRALRLPRLLAIADQDNAPSIRLLERLGMSLAERRPLSEGASPVCVFGLEAPVEPSADR